MPDLTSQLRAMADETAGRSRPIPADQLIGRGDRLRRGAVIRRAIAGAGAAGLVAAAVLAGTAGGAATGNGAVTAGGPASSRVLTLTATGREPDGTISLSVRYRDVARDRVKVLSVRYSGHCRVPASSFALAFVVRPVGGPTVGFSFVTPRGNPARFSGTLSRRFVRIINGKSGSMDSGISLSLQLDRPHRAPHVRKQALLTTGVVLDSLTY